MRITVAQRLKPFTHHMGEKCVIPGTLLAVQAFPSLAVIYDISGPQPAEVFRQEWRIEGPVTGFTLQQDLEKGCVRVWGTAKNGFFRYSIAACNESFAFAIDKAPEGFGPPSAEGAVAPLPPPERLSLGVDKQQDWDLVARRHSLAEILPFWLRLGTMTPAAAPARGGTAVLLLPERLSDLCLAGFEGLLFPRLHDDSHQGFALPPAVGGSPAALLTEGAKIIRSLFIQQEDCTIRILPQLPHDFHCGRFIDVCCGSSGTIDMEWRSRKVRRMVFRCLQGGVYTFVFPSGITTFRLRDSLNGRGGMCSVHTQVSLTTGSTYYFDKFM